MLVLGNCPVLYKQLLFLAKENGHSIYIRDVVNTDKQDDGAAFRTFHSELLKQISRHEIFNPEFEAIFVYLFILGLFYIFILH